MKRSTKAITNSAKNTESALSNGLINQHISVSFTTIIFTAKVSIHGLTDVNTKENGELIKCTVKELLVGQMEESISGSTLKIRKEATENLFGLIDVVTEENG